MPYVSSNVKEEIKKIEVEEEDDFYKKFLYGSGFGWSSESLENILKAKEEHNLVICDIYPDCQNKKMMKVAWDRVKNNPMGFTKKKLEEIESKLKLYQEIQLLLARENLKDENLTNEERCLLVLNCRILYNTKAFVPAKPIGKMGMGDYKVRKEDKDFVEQIKLKKEERWFDYVGV